MKTRIKSLPHGIFTSMLALAIGVSLVAAPGNAHAHIFVSQGGATNTIGEDTTLPCRNLLDVLRKIV